MSNPERYPGDQYETKDYFEALEASAENRFDSLEYNDADGTCKCAGCGQRYPLSAMNQASPSPFSMPICDACCDPGPRQYP